MNDQQRKDDPVTYYTGMGLALGLAFGLPLGAAIGDAGSGLAVGLAFGLIVGAAIGNNKKKKQEADGQTGESEDQ